MYSSDIQLLLLSCMHSQVHIHIDNYNVINISSITEDLLLATAKSEKRKALHYYITELVVVWSLCSVCTSVTKAVILYNTSCFLL